MTTQNEKNTRYEMFIFDISYFSGKLEAYFKFKEISYKRTEVTWWQLASKIVQQTGLMEVPVIHDLLDDIWLSDTTPMIEYFEENRVSRGPKINLIPQCKIQAFFSFLIGDFADEWLWKPAIYYRWRYKEDSELYGRRFVNEFLHSPIIPKFLSRKLIKIRMTNTYLKKDGIRDKKTAFHTEKLYLDTLSILEKHFQQYSFMFGNYPTFIDFCLFASMFRHFSIDPTPSKIMRQTAPAVYEWVARMWNVKESKICSEDCKLLFPIGSIPDSWIELLSLVKQYLIYLRHNSNAQRNGKKYFSFELDNVKYNQVEVVPYRSWRRERLQNKFSQLEENEKQIIEEILTKHDCWDDFISSPFETNLFKDRPVPPFTKGFSSQNSLFQKIRLFVTGTPRHANSLVVSPLLLILIFFCFLAFIFIIKLAFF